MLDAQVWCSGDLVREPREIAPADSVEDALSARQRPRTDSNQPSVIGESAFDCLDLAQVSFALIRPARTVLPGQLLSKLRS